MGPTLTFHADRAMWTNHARFRQFGNGGYVLKPDLLRFVPERKGAISFDPMDQKTYKSDPLTLSIKVV